MSQVPSFNDDVREQAKHYLHALTITDWRFAGSRGVTPDEFSNGFTLPAADDLITIQRSYGGIPREGDSEHLEIDLNSKVPKTGLGGAEAKRAHNKMLAERHRIFPVSLASLILSGGVCHTSTLFIKRVSLTLADEA